jgi:hypothetical protein
MLLKDWWCDYSRYHKRRHQHRQRHHNQRRHNQRHHNQRRHNQRRHNQRRRQRRQQRRHKQQHHQHWHHQHLRELKSLRPPQALLKLQQVGLPVRSTPSTHEVYKGAYSDCF